MFKDLLTVYKLTLNDGHCGDVTHKLKLPVCGTTKHVKRQIREKNVSFSAESHSYFLYK